MNLRENNKISNLMKAKKKLDSINRRKVRQKGKQEDKLPLLWVMSKKMIPGRVYQLWVKDASDISSRRRRRKRKASTDLLSAMKIASLMEMPPVVMIEDLFTKGNREIHYPDLLLKLWMKNTQPPHDSPSEPLHHNH